MAENKIRAEHYIRSEYPTICYFNPHHSMELHGFSDAAEVDYAANVVNLYEKTSNILIAKARVSPIREKKNEENITIPQLELCGVLLLAQLVEKTLNRTKILPNLFISSRVEKINKLVDLSYWSHVRLEDNAADCASMGSLPSELKNHPFMDRIFCSIEVWNHHDTKANQLRKSFRILQYKGIILKVNARFFLTYRRTMN